MAVGVLVKVLLRDGGGAVAQGKGGGDDKPENAKEWVGNKLKDLTLLQEYKVQKWQKHCLASLGQSSAG